MSVVAVSSKTKGWTASETSRSAGTPRNRLVIPRTSSTAGLRRARRPARAHPSRQPAGGGADGEEQDDAVEKGAQLGVDPQQLRDHVEDGGARHHPPHGARTPQDDHDEEVLHVVEVEQGGVDEADVVGIAAPGRSPEEAGEG